MRWKSILPPVLVVLGAYLFIYFMPITFKSDGAAVKEPLEDARDAQTAFNLLNNNPVTLEDYISLKREASLSQITGHAELRLRRALGEKGLTLEQVQKFLDSNRNNFKVVLVK